MVLNVTFWQNMPSHHMAPVQRELARFADYSVRTVFLQNISERRLEMGWSMPNFGLAEVTILNGNTTIAKQSAQASDGINFFNGFPVGALKTAFDNLPRRGLQARNALILEAGDTHDFKGNLRPLFHAIRTRELRNRVDFVLAFGSLGVNYYTRCGFGRERIFPFFYQTDNCETSIPISTSYPIRIIYCGQLSKRKGVDLLLLALAPLSHLDWNLEIVGDGPEALNLWKLAKTLNVSQRIKWRGFVASSEITEILRRKDICVVPSRFDGWGMLTNEAVSAGIPVVTTSRVGSKDIVEMSGAGCVATAPTPRALRKCLERLLLRLEGIDKAKAATTRISRQLTGKPAAVYLDALIQHSLNRRTDRFRFLQLKCFDGQTIR